MLALTKAGRSVLLAATLMMGGCFVESGPDDDEFVDESGTIVEVEADDADVYSDEDDVVIACRTECDNERTQCVLDCVGNSCAAVCNSEESDCITDCD